MHHGLDEEDRDLRTRLRDAFRLLRCDGGPFLLKETLSAAEAKAAGCVNNHRAETVHVLGWQCSQRQEVCEACPRFKAHRQGLAVAAERLPDLAVPIAARNVEADVLDGNGKAVEVAHGNAKAGARFFILRRTHKHTHIYPVVRPVAPSVEYSQNSAQYCQRCGDQLHVIVAHVPPPSLWGKGSAWPKLHFIQTKPPAKP